MRRIVRAFFSVATVCFATLDTIWFEPLRSGLKQLRSNEMDFNMRKMALLGMGALYAATAAHADTTRTLTFMSMTFYEEITYNFDNSVASSSATRAGGAFGLAGQLGFADNLFAFCSEVDAPMEAGLPVVYTESDIADLPSPDPMGAGRAAAMESHYALGYEAVSNSGNDSMYAAFAIVVWEIAQENWNGTDFDDLDIRLGAFQVSNISAETEATVQAMFAGIRKFGGGSYSITGWTNPDYQDLIVVPGPSIAMAGLLGLAGLRRRRRH